MNEAICRYNPTYVPFDYLAIRPDLDPMDQLFHYQNTESPIVPSFVTGNTCELLQDSALFPTAKGKNLVALAVDCIYYPGVTDFLAATVDSHSTLAVGTFMEYPTRKGTYQYIDGEGHYEIYDKNGIAMVKSTPKDNPHCYEHPVVQLSTPSRISYRDHTAIIMPLERVAVDGSGRCTMVKFVVIPDRHAPKDRPVLPEWKSQLPIDPYHPEFGYLKVATY